MNTYSQHARHSIGCCAAIIAGQAYTAACLDAPSPFLCRAVFPAEISP